MATYANNIEIKSSGRQTSANVAGDVITVAANNYAEVTVIFTHGGSTADVDLDGNGDLATPTQKFEVHNFTLGGGTVFGAYGSAGDGVVQIGGLAINFGAVGPGAGALELSYVIKGNA